MKTFIMGSRGFFLNLSIIVLVLLAGIPIEAYSQGGLLITPRRVVFDGKKKIVQVNLANSGKDTSTYLISFIQYRMTENGGFEQITEPDSGQLFADKYIRLFPREVTLAPGEAQLVKLQLRGYNKLKDGEYRSHIYFRLNNNVKALGEEKDIDTTTVSVRLIPIYGISIPAIIRKGKSTTKVSLSDLTLQKVNDTTQGLDITFNRTGNFSVYGDVTVNYFAPGSDKPAEVGLVRGLAVYTPNKLRHFILSLDNKYDYSKGKLKIVYTSKSDLDKDGILAENELILNK